MRALAALAVITTLGSAATASAQSSDPDESPDDASRLASSSAWSEPATAASPETPASPEEDPWRRVPAAIAARPLTLPAGMGRIHEGLFVRSASFRGFFLIVPVGFGLGVTDDLELGFSWPLPYDTTFYALGRFVVDPHVELGGAISITAPTLTRGDSLARLTVPVLLRPTEWMRVDTGLAVELLFASQISPLAMIPIAVTLSPHRAFFLGAQGTVEWLDGRRWQGEAGGFVGVTASTARGAFMDFRFNVQAYLPQAEFALSFSFAFYPRFWA